MDRMNRYQWYNLTLKTSKHCKNRIMGVISHIKSLSENFSKDELSTGKMKKSQVIARFLLPANKQATRTVDPGMGPFNNPTPCPKAGSDHFFPLFLLATTNVSLIASRLDQNVVPGRVISGIQTQ